MTQVYGRTPDNLSDFIRNKKQFVFSSAPSELNFLIAKIIDESEGLTSAHLLQAAHALLLIAASKLAHEGLSVSREERKAEHMIGIPVVLSALKMCNDTAFHAVKEMNRAGLAEFNQTPSKEFLDCIGVSEEEVLDYMRTNLHSIEC